MQENGHRQRKILIQISILMHVEYTFAGAGLRWVVVSSSSSKGNCGLAVGTNLSASRRVVSKMDGPLLGAFS
jgi:hypothetical protein